MIIKSTSYLATSPEDAFSAIEDLRISTKQIPQVKSFEYFPADSFEKGTSFVVDFEVRGRKYRRTGKFIDLQFGKRIEIETEDPFHKTHSVTEFVPHISGVRITTNSSIELKSWRKLLTLSIGISFEQAYKRNFAKLIQSLKLDEQPRYYVRAYALGIAIQIWWVGIWIIALIAVMTALSGGHVRAPILSKKPFSI